MTRQPDRSLEVGNITHLWDSWVIVPTLLRVSNYSLNRAFVATIPGYQGRLHPHGWILAILLGIGRVGVGSRLIGAGGWRALLACIRSV